MRGPRPQGQFRSSREYEKALGDNYGRAASDVQMMRITHVHRSAPLCVRTTPVHHKPVAAPLRFAPAWNDVEATGSVHMSSAP